MASQTIRLIKPYSLHGKGAVLTLDPGVAGELIRSGRAEAVQEAQAPGPEKKLKGKKTKK